MTRGIAILHKAERHLIFSNNVDGAKMAKQRETGSIRWFQRDFCFVVLKRCKKQNALIAPLLRFSGTHMSWEVWDCQSAKNASLQLRPYVQYEPGLSPRVHLLQTPDVASLNISDVPVACKGCTNLIRHCFWIRFGPERTATSSSSFPNSHNFTGFLLCCFMP